MVFLRPPTLPPMVHSLSELQQSLMKVPPQFLKAILALLSTGLALREVNAAIEGLFGSRDWRWSLLDQWNEWAVKSEVEFSIWSPSRDGLDAMTRVAVLVHTIMRLSSVGETGGWVKVLPAGNEDCHLCAERAKRPFRIEDEPPSALPPFHPGCRCTVIRTRARGGTMPTLPFRHAHEQLTVTYPDTLHPAGVRALADALFDAGATPMRVGDGTRG